MTAYLEIQKVLDAETEILESFSRQMEQMLDSRNLQSRFEDISPQIERVVINTGALLPPPVPAGSKKASSAPR